MAKRQNSVDLKLVSGTEDVEAVSKVRKVSNGVDGGGETESGNVKLTVHHVRFFNCQPKTINCICHDSTTARVAISRSDGSVEVHSSEDDWVQELTFPGCSDASVEALAWAGGRLFSAGLAGNVVELDISTQSAKETVSSNAGPIWCLCTNKKEDKLAAGTEDGCVVLFDVEGDLEYLRGFGKQEGRILSIAWYECDGESVIVTGGINNLRQWSVKSGQPLSRMTVGRKFQKDTIVWCVTVTRDFTIISGDSRGVVTFWNGKESTQIRTFHCHKADVLSLSLSEDEQTVYSSGVDASLFQFSLYNVGPHSERTRWVQQLLHSRHTHDIRALAYKNGCLASGGVDAVLRIANLKGIKGVWDVDPFPQTGLVNVAVDKNLVQLQYPTYIEIWALGTANQPHAAERGILPLTKKPVRLLQINSRSERRILCSAISANAVVAFSDTKGVRLFQLEVITNETVLPQVSLNRLLCSLTEPARLMSFASNGQALVVVFTSGSLCVMAVDTGLVEHSIKSISTSPIHRLSTSPNGSFFATATTDHGIHIYSVETGQHVCSCPVHQSQVSALAFSPHKEILVIAYSNNWIYEFDLKKRQYTQWSRQNSDKLFKSYLRPVSNVKNIMFAPGRPDEILFHTDATLLVLDKTKVGRSGRHKDYIRRCHKYKYLLSADFLSNGQLVVVECTPSALEENFPPSLKQKKFGAS